MIAHPYAEIFPLLTDAELQSLAEDIRKHGLRNPAVVDSGDRILDGRNREAACKIAGVPLRTTRFAGTEADALAFVVSVNLHRRHLNESQRAMVAARLANMPVGKPPNCATLHNSGVSQNAAAKLLNVSRRSVGKARRVIDDGTPQLQAAVSAGDVSVTKAAAICDRPKAEQKALCEKTVAPKPSRTPIGVIRANEAVNCLKAIPKNDPLRKRGFQIVKDWIRQNGRDEDGDKDSQRVA